MTSKSTEQELALAALIEVCEPGSVGDFVGEKEISKNDLEISFNCTLPAYKNWNWQVVLSRTDKKSPYTISEIVLLASENALLAPAWVPWAERIAEFRKQLREEGRAATDAEADAIISGLSLDEPEAKTPKVRVRQRRIRVVEESTSLDQEVTQSAKENSDEAGADEEVKVRSRKPRAKKQDQQSERPKRRTKKQD